MRVPPAALLVLAFCACGGMPAAGPPARRVPHRPPPAAVEDPPAPGAQLAAGRLGSILDGLEPGEPWRPDAFGPDAAGPNVPSHHVLARRTSAGAYTLHVVAEDLVRPPRLPADAPRLETTDPELEVVALPPDDEVAGASPLAGREDATLLGQLLVAVRGGTLVHVGLLCVGEPACEADDAASVAAALARSLRRGPPLRSGGEWAVRLPETGSRDRVLRIALPEGVVGLAPYLDFDREHLVAVALESGNRVLHIEISLPPIQRAAVDDPAAERVACAPFDCSVRFSDRALEESLRACIASAPEERADALERLVALGGGRLRVRLPTPSAEEDSDPYAGWSGGLREPSYHLLRFGHAGLLHLLVTDLLRPSESPPREPVESLEAGDAELSIARRVGPVPPEEQYEERPIVAELLVAERGGSTFLVQVVCPPGEPCALDEPGALAALARRFARGRPLEAPRTWRVDTAVGQIEIDLPDGYVVEEVVDHNHGGSVTRAFEWRERRGALVVEHSGGAVADLDNIGRRTGRRAELSLGGVRVPMIERRPSHAGRSRTVWTLDLGCREQVCVLVVEADDAVERERLVAALAAARVEWCARGYAVARAVVRESPSGRAVGRLDVEDSVTIEEVLDRSLRISAPQRGWVPAAAIERVCE